jgi:hypothetical protein
VWGVVAVLGLDKTSFTWGRASIYVRALCYLLGCLESQKQAMFSKETS